MTDKPDLPPSSVAAFTEALKGGRGSLDAWLEVNDEREVAAHIEAYASACVSSATAEKDAEIDALRTRLEDTVRDSTNKIEALRAEVERVTCELMDALTRADKLAEALRHQRWCRTCAEDGWESCEDGRKADALLHPTAAQENDDA